MQISSGPGGFSPLLPENHFPGLDGAPPDSQNGGNSITAKLLLNNGGNTLAIPLALNFANAGASDKPSAINFGASPAGNSGPANNPASTSQSDGSNSADGMMQELQQMLQQFLKELMQLFGMNTGQNKDDASSSSPASGVGSGSGSSGSGAASGADDAGAGAPAAGPAGASGASADSLPPGDTSLKTSDPTLQKIVSQFGGQYEKASAETGVPAKLLAALTMQESGGDVNAKSTNPGNGLTDSGMNQINPDTYRAMQSKYPDKLGSDMNSPANQIMCSALMLKEGKEKFGSYDAALRAYNSGDNQVNLHNLSSVSLGDPNYVNEVNSHMAKFA
ncbi:Transglycosylase SLT domain [Cedecea davisae]|uniref:Transglycosylase SLT domain protein n=1 Tax=Cedecea davisae DSM 4568 TaxID=566551 RepID=S3IY02_9ENTR|nr:lytic transglycosylase domain-containing protein [Cedecea davisae]EPF18573.1 transglycosylase SLT domain protein [Cedecea davisae DSM 4568]SUX28617.1 Transglycosylase SLT domain [Cedecea davisae]